MALRTEIEQARNSILKEVEQAARGGSTREVVARSRMLEVAEELLASHDALEARFRAFARQVDSGGDEPPPRPPASTGAEAEGERPRDSAKAQGERRRQTFLADARERGIHMDRVAGVRYASPTLRCVGIATASETEKYPNRWFLGLAPADYDGFVLLCEDRSGLECRFVAPPHLAASLLPKLSRDEVGQIKFHVTRDDGHFYLDVPSHGRVAIDALREQFANLTGNQQDRPDELPGSTVSLRSAQSNSSTAVNPTQTPRSGDHQRRLGTRGNENLVDYLLPIIRLMRSGAGHQEALKQTAARLDVRYNTALAQCTRMLGLSTDEFVKQVNTGTIVATLRARFPDRHDEIEKGIAAA